MHGHRPRDWARFEREMRVWGRRFERDMRAMGETIADDVAASAGASSSRKCRHSNPWCGPWAWGPMHAGFEADDRDARRSEREERRRQRHARRRARASAKAWCGGPMGVMHFWWLIFPLFFMGRGLLRELGGVDGIAASASGALEMLFSFSLAAPLARLLSNALGVSFLGAYGLLFALVVITGAAAAVGLKNGSPRRAL